MTGRNMNLLDFYKEHVLIDPEVKDEDVGKVLGISNKFNTRTGLDYMYNAYQSFSDLQNYMGYRENGFPEYFKTVSGNKVIKVGDYMGIIDLWYPREICLFDLSRNPIMAGWIMSDLMDRMCGTEDITDLLKLPDPKTTLNESISRLLTEIKGTEFYGFWMGEARNSGRKRGIRIRRLEVMSAEIEGGRTYYYSVCPEMVMKDKDTREELIFNSYNLGGWSFYLSKELLADRLKDLENFWMRGYDDKIRSLDYEVKTKKKELENLINRRKEFENGINEYQKKLHRLLWKSF
jgi:hypothetical protein